MNVTEITAKSKEENKIIRLAAYCRVSSDSADQLHSFAAQIRYYKDYEQKHPEYKLVDIYADEGLTGTSMEKRDELNRLIRDCKKGKIDRIVVKSVSRFARNTQELLVCIRLLKELGISVYFEEQGIDTDKLNMEMIVTFPGMAAQQESESISGNMRWSYKKRMESGEFNCCNPAYGYILKDGQLMINEPQAAIIRRIFDLYLSGVGKQSIANILNDEGVSRRYGKDKWYESTVHYILNNERYMGDALLQKSYTTETLPFKRKMNHGELPKYYVENSNPPIVSREIYQAVQTLQNSRKNVYSNSKGKYLLSKVMRCPDCGMTFRRQIVKGTAYWLCSNKAASMTDCRPLRLKETAVYETFTMLVQKLTDNRKTLLGDLIRQVEAMQNRTSDIFNLGVPILCPKCCSKMCRRHDSNRKCQDWWLCQNDNCKNIISISDNDLIYGITQCLNTVISNSDAIEMITDIDKDPSLDVRRFENEISRVLDSHSFDKNILRKKILECVSLKYKDIDSQKYTSKILKADFANASPLSAFSMDLFNRTVKAIKFSTGGAVSIILLNDQQIGKEQSDDTNSSNTTEISTCDSCTG